MPLLDLAPFRYLLVGGANTIAGLLIIYGSKWFMGLGDIKANLIGYLCGFVLSFVLNKQWTFRFAGDALPALMRFTAVTVVAYLANISTVLLLVRVGMDSYLAQTLGIVPYTLVGYLGSRFFAFGTLRDSPIGQG